MNKLLAYGLWILLSLSSVSAMWCHDCEKKYVKEKLKCPNEQAKCWAGEGESCYIQNLYLGTKLLFTRFGCFRGCKYVNKPAPFLWHTFACCNKNYCNKHAGVEL